MSVLLHIVCTFTHNLIAHDEAGFLRYYYFLDYLKIFALLNVEENIRTFLFQLKGDL